MKQGEVESVGTCNERGGGLFVMKGGGLFVYAYTLHAHLLLLWNWNVLTQLQFIATVHEVNNVRTS